MTGYDKQRVRLESGARLIAAERRRIPELIELVRPLSLAVRVEMELVRAMRLQLLPRSDPGLEADLWSSSLLQTRDVSAVVLLPEVKHWLHRALRKRPAELEIAWQLVERYHRNLDPVILREERTAYLSLSGELEGAERQLGPVIKALRRDPKDRSLRRWAGRFLDRLPEGTKSSEAARTLRREASSPMTAADADNLKLGLRRVQEGLWITHPPEPKSLEIMAPDTLSIAWPDETGWQARSVDLPSHSQPSMKADYSRFEIEPRFVPTPPGRLLVSSADRREMDLLPEGERPLLYIRLDEQLGDLPVLLNRQLTDLNWRYEMVGLNEPAPGAQPAVWLNDYLSPGEWPIERLRADLDSRGIARLGTDRIHSGQEAGREIEQAILTSRAAVVVIGGKALGSDWFHREVGLLRERQKGDPGFLVLLVPASKSVLADLEAQKSRYRLIFEIQMVMPDSFDRQIAHIGDLLGKTLDARPPSDRRVDAHTGNAKADATMLCLANGGRLDEVVRSLDGGFGNWSDLDWATSHNQPIVLLTDRLAGMLPPGAIERDAAAGERARDLAKWISVLSGGGNPDPAPMLLRRALIDIERGREEQRVAQFLQNRFQITREEQDLLDNTVVRIDDKPGFLVAGGLAVIRGDSMYDPPESVKARVGNTSKRVFTARRIRFDNEFAVYRMEDPDYDGPVLVPSRAPVRREDRCCAQLWSAADSVQVAGVVSEPDFADIPGSPHALTFRLSRMKEGQLAFGPLVRDGELIGVVYQTVFDAGFDGEGDLAYASPIDRLLDLLTTHRAVQVDWTTARPGGNWAPPANEIEIHRELEPIAQLWLFSKQISDSGTPRFQLEAHWGQVRTPRPDDAAWLRTVSAAALFPPNDCTEWLAALVHEQSTLHPIESASQTSSPVQTTAIDEWLERLPELTAEAATRLEAMAGELLDGSSRFLRSGLHWVLRGIDLEKTIEPAENRQAKSIDPEAVELADRLDLTGHRGTVRTLDVTADGGFAITAGNSHPDQTVKVWDLRSGREIFSFKDQAEAGSRTALAISSGGEYAVSAYMEELRLWNLESGLLQKSFKAAIQPPWNDVCFADTGHLLAVASDQAYLCEIDTGIVTVLDNGSGEALAGAASDSGDLLAVLRRDGVAIWRRKQLGYEVVDRVEQSVAAAPYPWQPPPLRFTTDGRLLFNSPPAVWTEGAGLQTVERLHIEGIADVDRTGNALWVSSSASFQVVGHDGQSLTPELKCDDREISCAAISADGSTVVGADYDHHLWVWRLVKPAA